MMTCHWTACQNCHSNQSIKAWFKAWWGISMWECSAKTWLINQSINKGAISTFFVACSSPKLTSPLQKNEKKRVVVFVFFSKVTRTYIFLCDRFFIPPVSCGEFPFLLRFDENRLGGIKSKREMVPLRMMNSSSSSAQVCNEAVFQIISIFSVRPMLILLKIDRSQDVYLEQNSAKTGDLIVENWSDLRVYLYDWLFDRLVY